MLFLIGLILLCILLLYVYSLVEEAIYKKKEQNESIDYEKTEELDEIIENTSTVKLTESYLTLDNYIGQSNNIEYLKGHIKHSLDLDKPLPHIVLWGSGGLGKSTLMKATALEMGGRFIEIVPANLRTIKDLFSMFFLRECPECYFENPFSSGKCLKCKTDIKIYFQPIIKLLDKDIVFLEECHGLKVDIEEAMYSLMQDKYMVIRYNGLDQRMEFPNITIAGATTRLGDLNKPFRDRFKIDIKLSPYSEQEIKIISQMYCKNKEYKITEEALNEIAKISYGVPRIAKKYIDDSITRGENISIKEINEILSLLDIDENGLNKFHRKILEYVHIRGQAGHTSIASSVGLQINIYLEVYEPALMYKEYLWQSNRGRIVTKRAKEFYFKNCECKYCEKIV